MSCYLVGSPAPFPHTMPRFSARQEALSLLRAALRSISIAQALELWNAIVAQIEPDLMLSDSNSEPSSSFHSSSPTPPSTPSTIPSYSMSDSGQSNILFFQSEEVIRFQHAILARIDEVQRARVLHARIPTIHAPQIHLLKEWKIHRPWLFCRKLRVSYEVFIQLVEKIHHHPIFSTASNPDSNSKSDDMPLPESHAGNQQLPVWFQLAIFLNGAGHYDNAATSQDIAEWAGVAVGTVHNCYKRVMLSLLHLHDQAIHFDPIHCEEDYVEKERAKAWVEARSISEWRGGFLCVDGSTFNFFQKPGHHGEVFFDRKSRYSVTNQVGLNLFHQCRY
jgi:hypothetical protein